MTIQENMFTVLAALVEQPREAFADGERIAELTNLSPGEINDAVRILVESGYVEWHRELGTAPYDFGLAQVTPRGRYEYESIITAEEVANTEVATEGFRPITTHPSPVGSPFGFTDLDWEIVAERKSRHDILYVVLGMQFSSDIYNTEQLQRNVEFSFQSSVNTYNALANKPNPIELEFQSLAAGYGEHLFNQIARDIIAADIAVFETSDQNPNVMIEMGVALTWGVRVLPIRNEGSVHPPSDISGQTWAEYRNSGEEFVARTHEDALFRMVERAARKKAPSV